jgi:hypothetical protein
VLDASALRCRRVVDDSCAAVDPVDAGSTIAAMIGVVAILLALFVVGPIGLFVVGALWSGAFGWMAADDADRRANEPETQPSAS